MVIEDYVWDLVNKSDIEKLNRIYNFLLDANYYNSWQYYIRDATHFEEMLKEKFEGSFIKALSCGYDCDISPYDKYYYFEFETDIIKSFSELTNDNAPYTTLDLVAGLKTEYEDGDYESIDEMLGEIK